MSCVHVARAPFGSSPCAVRTPGRFGGVAQLSQVCFGYPGILHQLSLKPDPEISVAVHRDDHLASLTGQGVVATSDSIYDPPSSFQDSYKFPSGNNLHRAPAESQASPSFGRSLVGVPSVDVALDGFTDVFLSSSMVSPWV